MPCVEAKTLKMGIAAGVSTKNSKVHIPIGMALSTFQGGLNRVIITGGRSLFEACAEVLGVEDLPTVSEGLGLELEESIVSQWGKLRPLTK